MPNPGITTAILLAAGEGSRLRSAAASKPLCHVGGRPLIDRAIHGLAEAGLQRVVVVLGYEAEAIEAHLAARDWPIAVETVRTSDYRQPNGVSVLAAEAAVAGGEALLAMCDHLVEPALYARVAQAGAGGGARLAIDRGIHSDLVDLDDVTCVRTQGEAITAIGKHLPDYDAFDTGVFAIGGALFAALHTLPAPSLTEGMRVLAAQGSALTVDCSDLAWIDVDDPAALDKAEDWLRAA
ncbi:NTP transferase domain-containing protein [Sphingomonas psychrotolerans]|uniref:NTP transferase domain-containing protein n=1 Tax=Sphingomonas psychrotolerans TaxID=1327635 RepID=A0ABU3N4K4_9SPHN|nr:NTP transferase domain-containing protein [Sphingomonas psychrotolerans]MDT8759464.1 NTP transferase domain-containing protein [Sphingomonas psychrotolerans]